MAVGGWRREGGEREREERVEGVKRNGWMLKQLMDDRISLPSLSK